MKDVIQAPQIASPPSQILPAIPPTGTISFCPVTRRVWGEVGELPAPPLPASWLPTVGHSAPRDPVPEERSGRQKAVLGGVICYHPGEQRGFLLPTPHSGPRRLWFGDGFLGVDKGL